MKLSANEARREMFGRLNQAEVHHDLLCALRDASADKTNLIKLNRNRRFFAGVESALFYSTVVLLYSLYETRKDTINFFRLLDALDDIATVDQLESYRGRIEQVKPLWIKIGILRNEMIGHQSLEGTALAVQTKASLNTSHVDKFLEASKKLLLDISSAHYDTHIDFMDNTRTSVATLLSRLAL